MKYEKIQKIYRGYRNANCIDGIFVEEVLSQSIGTSKDVDNVMMESELRSQK